ncbi:MAG TPA: NADH-quinone oxidoreductase subunit J [Porphyromonadaceae bacterium]|jgi:NADH-quinone oxidoreductase subunit J|uniref:NADH-quinone oxidoreductase subunit J family protein n=1 Tax=Limibacterium fermenti TaxID=3229863 RepID=UPI000E9D7E94|nr:NADH-quinone oxidoreductase subunit J [Porphyromonadaceae bacterium]HBL33573.1 NADH-quinone oxidoreductase subunit J [Porphyromonadaceae bacterium]HBX20107.1 NADH-quinone oxidoreductase subunit J [Porphyromonadaceae bacterium]HBX45717.1 NADH-quinone oxidoreductase subunit J [Porphyromonadaceae bacterium]HCM20377.1 NADH-quinone oxidoreductase subunit J [Porphyromonadaceae bacterium]
MTEQIIFYILAIVIAVFSILAVTSKQVVRSATYLLFVLLGTAGIYMLLNYYFLFAVQVSVYAGGIMVLFIMAIFLTHKPGIDVNPQDSWKVKSSAVLSLAGLVLCGYIILNNVTRVYRFIKGDELQMQDIGTAMMGTNKYQYLLPFEVISVLLLACIVGAILIARKDNGNDENINKLD